ncbi:MAG: hypothetical protein ACKVKO_05150 [Acidimicrobiales bacterium]
MTVLYSARTSADVFDEGMMAWWAAKHRRSNFHAVYIAGSPDFVNACEKRVSELGAPPNRIFVERYTPQTAPS